MTETSRLDRRLPPLAPGLALALLLAVAPAAGRAETFTVTTTADSGPGSLRQAVLDANASTTDPSDTIQFMDLPASAIITLASPLPDIEGDLTIDGTTAMGLTITQGAPDEPIFRLVMSSTTTVTDLDLSGGPLQLGAGTRVAFNLSADSTFEEDIEDSGRVIKQGDAKLTLLGTNTYGDGTVVTGGTLEGNTTSLQGPITNDAIVVFAQDTNGTYAGPLSGMGSVQKTGTGTVTFTGSNSYEGGTTVSAGALQGDTDALQGDITNESLVVFQQPTDGTYADVISGSGVVRKTGAGTLLLSGANTYSGTTDIQEGAIRASGAALRGPVSVASGASIIFDEPSSGSFGGAISGAGALVKEGAGALTLTGVNNYDGGTTVSAGSLRGTGESLQGAIDNAAEVVFDQAGDGSFTGAIAGAGTVEKRGAGRLLFAADQTYTGLTTITGGRLDVGAQLMSAVRVASGGVLGGTGSIGGDADVEGTVSPGTAATTIGTLAVGGDVDFGDGSVLEIDVNETGGDRLTVSGTATITDGAVVRVVPAEGDYETPVTVDILTAGTIVGAFPDPMPELAFLDTRLEQIGNTIVRLEVVGNDEALATFAETPNQEAVGIALTEAEGSGTADLDTVFASLRTLTVDEVPEALDEMAGEQLTGFATTRIAVARRMHHAIQARIRNLAWRSSDPLFGEPTRAGPSAPASAVRLQGIPNVARAFASPLGSSAAMGMAAPLLTFEPGDDEIGVGGWVDGYGLFGDLDEGSDPKQIDYTLWGATLGLDFRPSDHWILGAAGGYANTDIDYDDLSGSAEADTYHGAVYAAWATPRFLLGASIRYAYSDMETDRRIAFSDLVRGTSADFDGIEIGARVEASLALADLGGVRLQAMASYEYDYVQQDEIDESGADSLDLSVGSDRVDSYVTGLGLRVSGALPMEDDIHLLPELDVRWLHEFGDDERRLGARLNGGVGAGNFTVAGAEVPRDVAAVRAGWAVASPLRFHFFVAYDGILSPDQIENGVTGGLRVYF